MISSVLKNQYNSEEPRAAKVWLVGLFLKYRFWFSWVDFAAMTVTDPALGNLKMKRDNGKKGLKIMNNNDKKLSGCNKRGSTQSGTFGKF